MTSQEAIAAVDELVKRGVTPDVAARAVADLARRSDPGRLLAADELAALTGRSVRTVERWLAEETVPVVKAGGITVGVHFPTFLAVCTAYAQPRGVRQPVRAGEIAARLASGGGQ